MSFNSNRNTITGWFDNEEQTSVGSKYKVILALLHSSYAEGAYGASWTSFNTGSDLPSTPANGRGPCTRHNTSDGTSRVYYYVNSTWKYHELT